MKITIENYEEYALDFLEGSLDQEAEKAFRRFLEDHPVVREELEGIDSVVLIPESDIQYPNKEALYRGRRSRLIPFFPIRRIAAAAVILLATAALYMVWNTSDNPDNTSITDNQPQTPRNEDLNLPAIKTPMPVEQPETDVMAHEGNVPGQADHTAEYSPALSFGQHSPKNGTDHSGEPDDFDNTGSDPSEGRPLLAIESSEIEIDPEIMPDPAPLSSTTSMEETVALLPGINSSVSTSQPLPLKSLTSLKSQENNTFEIRIPGQFLSETWGDVSFANLKNKLLPEFLNKN